MNNRIALYSFALALAGVLFGIIGGAARVLELVWPNTPSEVHLALAAIALILVAYAVYGFAHAATARQRPDEHETDAADVLRYLITESRWAEREHRRLNFREMVNHLEEFRRAASEDGLCTRGIPATGGRAEPIDSYHWASADINPATAEQRGGVSTKTRMQHPQLAVEYAAIKVRTNHWQRIWPRARFYERWWTRTYVGMKKVWYLLTPDAWTYRWRKWRGEIRSSTR
jgi:hypothetical protein